MTVKLRKSKVKTLKRYQGREITSTIKANTLPELNKMLTGIRRYARLHGLGTVKVLRKHKDPDGGYEAIIQAHNWNPIKWVSEKWEARGGGYEARMTRAEEKEKRRLRQLELEEKRAERKRRLILARAKIDDARATREAAISRIKRAKASRPKGRGLLASLASGATTTKRRSPSSPKPRKRATTKKRDSFFDWVIG